MLLRAVSLAALSLAPCAGSLTFLMASDTHFGHDVLDPGNGNVTVTALQLNIVAVQEMNTVANGSFSWPASLGGGVISEPEGLIISGDLIDNGSTEWNQVDNFTSVYGLTGTDGLFRYRVFEGRGNHDGNASTQPGDLSVAMIIGRNQVRLVDPAFNLTSISTNNLHYGWRWAVPADDGSGATCGVHFFQLNTYAGHICDGCAPVECFYNPTKPCSEGFSWPEDSLGFLETALQQVVGSSNEPVFVIQHYCFDGYSNSWYSSDQRAELISTLLRYNVAGVICGHTHVANIYSTINNGTMVPFGTPGAIPVYNVGSTQKEDGQGNPLPSEYMIAEISLDAATNNATFRIGQRVGYTWGNVMAATSFSCPAKK